MHDFFFFFFFVSLSRKVTINEINLLIKRKKNRKTRPYTCSPFSIPRREDKTERKKKKRWNVTQFAVQITRSFSLCLSGKEKTKQNKTTQKKKEEMEERRADKRLHRFKRMVRKRRIKKKKTRPNKRKELVLIS